jgi:hypothetical protein
VHPPEELGRNEVAAAAPAEAFQGLAHDFFRLAIGICLGVVEKIDPGIVGRRHHFDRVFYADLCMKCHPGPERQFADLDTSLSEMAVVHYCSQ